MAEPVRKRRTQTERRETTRLRLVEATVEKLSAEGVAGTTTLEIQRATGLTAGTLHYHFPTKTDLFVSAFVHLADQQVTALAEAATKLDECTDPVERARSAVAAMWTESTGPRSQALLELIRFSRTDEPTRDALTGLRRPLIPDRNQAFARLFGDELSARAGFQNVLRMLTLSMFGVAVVSDTLTRKSSRQLLEDLQNLALRDLGLVPH